MLRKSFFTVIAAALAYTAGAQAQLLDQAMQQGKILSAKSWQQMYTPVKDKYALGVVADSLYGRPTLSHGGGIFDFVTDFLRFPKDDFVVVVLCNNNSASISNISKSLQGWC